jgi:hypothetical protein
VIVVVSRMDDLLRRIVTQRLRPCRDKDDKRLRKAKSHPNHQLLDHMLSTYDDIDVATRDFVLVAIHVIVKLEAMVPIVKMLDGEMADHMAYP